MARRYTDTEIQAAVRLLLLKRSVRAINAETGMSLGKISQLNQRLKKEGARAFGLDAERPEADTGYAPAPVEKKPRRQRAQPSAIRAPQGQPPQQSDTPHPPPRGVVLGPTAPRCELTEGCCGRCPAAIWDQWVARFCYLRAMIGTTDLTAVRGAGGVLVDVSGTGSKGVFLVEEWLDLGQSDIELARYDTPAARFVLDHRAAIAISSEQLDHAVDNAAALGQGSALKGLVDLRASVDPEQFGKDGRPINVGSAARGDDVDADLLRQLRERRADEDAEAAG